MVYYTAGVWKRHEHDVRPIKLGATDGNALVNCARAQVEVVVQ